MARKNATKTQNTEMVPKTYLVYCDTYRLNPWMAIIGMWPHRLLMGSFTKEEQARFFIKNYYNPMIRMSLTVEESTNNEN